MDTLNLSTISTPSYPEYKNIPLVEVSANSDRILRSGSPADQIFHIDPLDGTIEIRRGNPILLSHFSPKMQLVPGVLLATLLRKGAGGLPAIGNTYTEFLLPIKPDSELRMSDNGSYYSLQTLKGNSWKDAVTIRSSHGHSIGSFHFSIEPERVDQWYEAKDWLPHGDSFRFVDEVGYADEEGDYIFRGKYILQEEDIDNGGVPFWLLEECGAQCLLGAKRALGGDASPYSTYRSSLIKPLPGVNLEEILRNTTANTEIYVVGRSIKKSDDVDECWYTLFLDGKAILNASIEGNTIPAKIWTRMNKGPNQ